MANQSSEQPGNDIDQRIDDLRQQYISESPAIDGKELPPPVVGREIRMFRVPRWVFTVLVGLFSVTVILVVVMVVAPRLDSANQEEFFPELIDTPLPTPPPPTEVPLYPDPTLEPPPDPTLLPPPPTPTFLPAP